MEKYTIIGTLRFHHWSTIIHYLQVSHVVYNENYFTTETDDNTAFVVKDNTKDVKTTLKGSHKTALK